MAKDRRLNVKPADQETGYCGPTSLKMVLRFYGDDHGQKELARLSHATHEDGAPGEQIVSAAKKLGYKAWLRDDSDIEDLKDLVDKGIPVIVDWFSKDMGHYSVVTKIDRKKKTITIQDPEIARSRTMDLDDFVNVWFDYDSEKPDDDEFIVGRMIVVEPKKEQKESVRLIRALINETWKKERINRESPVYKLVGASEDRLNEMADEISRRIASNIYSKLKDYVTGSYFMYPLSKIPLYDLDRTLSYVDATISVSSGITSTHNTGGQYRVVTRVDDNTQLGYFHIDVEVQPGTEFNKSFVRNELLTSLIETLRHELQHHQQYLTGSLDDPKHPTLKYTLPDLCDWRTVMKYFKHPREVDAYITSQFQTALRKAKGDEVEFEAEMDGTLQWLSRYLRSQKIPNDVVKHQIDKVRRKWLGWLRQKYDTQGD